jgi:hypothetical protein
VNAGRIARMSTTTKVKYLIGTAAFVAFLFSVSQWFGGDRERGLFVAIWVPSILALGNLLLVGRGRD